MIEAWMEVAGVHDDPADLGRDDYAGFYGEGVVEPYDDNWGDYDAEPWCDEDDE